MLQPEGGERPFVSVLLPVRDEAAYIAGCIEALAAQDYPRDCFEVLLIDGDSSDGTVAVARAAAERAGLALTVIANARRSTAAGLNLGIAAARGEVIVRVDGHTRVQPRFISESVRALQESGADAAGGSIETIGRGRVGRAIALAMTSPFGIGDTAFRQAASDAVREVDSVPFAAYRRDVFERIGGFAEDIDRGEDDELNYRLREAGGRIVLTPALRTEYYCRDSYAGLLRQYWGYGLAKAAVLRRHPRRLRWRHLVPSALVLALLGGLGGASDRRLGLIASLAAGAYAAANLAVSLRIGLRGHAPEAGYLPGAFACIHLAAGAGMLAGLARNRRRRGQPLSPSPSPSDGEGMPEGRGRG